MPTYTKPLRSSSHSRELRWLSIFRILLACSTALVAAVTAFCEEFARPPEFPQEVKDIFFEDAREALVGPPPKTREETSQATARKVDAPESDAQWKQLIDADALTAEVKRIGNRLALLVRKSQSRAASHEEFRRELTMLAALFSVIRAYPDDIRWKSSAGSMEQSCLRAAASCAEGSEGCLAAVYETFVQLNDLLSGQPVVENESPGESATPQLPPLMQQIEFMLQEELPPLIVKQAEFRKQAQSVSQEAQLLAMLSQVIRREEYGFAEDETYRSHAEELRVAAKQLHEAAAAQNFEKALQSLKAIDQACANCHADYRG